MRADGVKRLSALAGLTFCFPYHGFEVTLTSLELEISFRVKALGLFRIELPHQAPWQLRPDQGLLCFGEIR